MENSTNQILGGWSPYSCEINADARKAFDEALEELLGVDYEPVAVATQVVAGLNYSFFCNSKVVAPNTPWRPALVSVHQPLKGKAQLVDIRVMEPFVYQTA